MECHNSSDFITEGSPGGIEILDLCGATSLAYKICIDGQVCFMKKLRPELRSDSRYRDLFYKEFNTGKSIRSPYIVKYLNIKDDADGLCIIMEYVNGQTLKEKIEKKPEYFRQEKNIKNLLIQLCEALKALHNENVAHLDITPSNIIISQISNNVKLIDLGFCVSDWNDRTAGYTAGFQAPELEGKCWNEIDAQSDIYSVGMLLQYIKEQTGVKFSRKINNFMQRCLCKKSERFANCDEAIRALEKRNGLKIATIGSAVAITAAIALATLFQGHEKGEPHTISTTYYGVDYSILSHEDSTCTVTGGVGYENNIYIEPEITIGNRLYRTKAIADSAFCNSDILSVHIPEGIEFIGKGAFYRCDSIVTINLPSTIKDFNGAFVDMGNLKRVKIPVVKNISTTAFVDAEELTDIYIPEGVERLCRDAFVSCIKLKRVSLPQTLKVIERGVFYNCNTLEEIAIPAGVVEIGDYAFYECHKLRHIYCHATTPPRITAILNTSGIVVHVPAASLDAYRNDFYWGGYNLQPIQ